MGPRDRWLREGKGQGERRYREHSQEKVTAVGSTMPLTQGAGRKLASGQVTTFGVEILS